MFYVSRDHVYKNISMRAAVTAAFIHWQKRTDEGRVPFQVRFLFAP